MLPIHRVLLIFVYGAEFSREAVCPELIAHDVSEMIEEGRVADRH